MPLQSDRPVAVFVHVHYLDVWQDMARLLEERLQIPFRLLITSSLPVTEFAEPQTAFLRGITVIRVENRGRDIRPFLMALDEADDFATGLKLHTKRSTHRLHGKAWRDGILTSLLPAAPAAAALARVFDDHLAIGQLAPRGCLLGAEEWIEGNRAWMERVATLLNRPLTQADWGRGAFAAGSMFWFRRDAIASLADPRLFDLFEEENGQTDGTLAHAIERLFSMMAAKDGYQILSTASVPSLRPGLSPSELFALSQVDRAEVGPLFRIRPAARLVARHAPFLLKAYSRMPGALRSRLRNLVARD
ncbi:hypothetical protein GCM10011390_49950 [Aureimonas endophytica]|uniref:Rhamnan synthesis protein F n=1 Tax=Aureimonas endophytica TaxID=2027858 RepID=A0A917EEN9_9HYPH|nr:rhamnan synthesis F family protein [Aureimonas endophytica]GGE24518.1 hypothetical protein GCM10011390_49950 [Aureimonas endophytica]